MDLTSTNSNHPKVAESENIEANHLGFTKFLFQQYSQQLGLNNNHFPVEFAFNFYVNDKITDCLGGTVNIESTRENFYTKLFQHTSLPRNYNFAPIIREINQTIERYTQQQFPITYADKGKRRLQTPVLNYQQTCHTTIYLKALSTFHQQTHLHYIQHQYLDDYHFKPLQPPQQLQQPLTSPQQQLQQPPQQQIIMPMAYALIVKLEKYTSEKDDAQAWLNDIEKAIAYFSNNNSINWLANTFTTIKQGENEATDYFTAPQILNQFIRDFQAAVTNTRDFEAAELEANYVQAVNLVMNRLSELDSKLKQFSDSINQKLEDCVPHHHPINYGSKRCISATTVKTNNRKINIENPITANSICHLSPALPTHLSAAALGNLLAPTNSNTAIELTSKQNLKAKTDIAKLEIVNVGPLTNLQFHSTTIRILTIEFGHQNYLSLLITLEDATSNHPEPNQKQPLISNIPPATISNNKFLTAIFPFEFKETTPVLLFSRTALDIKLITIMYTDVKIDGYAIKLILDSKSAGSIITRQFMDQLGHQIDCAASPRIITTDGATKTPIDEINDFSIEVNGIIVLIKVLVMKATQYQALVGNN
ncbi:hypothetical protein G9A89_009390 [Geosiphon pyriformis]|nr:hypothetical protein G9A89_009390 [Geosiphon pyriformis]